MKKKLILILFGLITFLSFSQNSELILVKAGEDPAKVIPRRLTLRYSEFKTGQLFFATGKPSAKLQLNYNSLFDEMMLIDKNGDTLFLGADQAFVYVEIEKDQYYHDTQKGYFEILAGNDRLKLVSKTQFEIKRKELSGSNGYGSVSGSNTAIIASRVNSNSVIKNENVSYQKTISYFLMDEDKRSVKANKSSLIKFFPEHKDEIKDYLNKHRVNFDKENDLKQTINYCLQLS